MGIGISSPSCSFRTEARCRALLLRRGLAGDLGHDLWRQRRVLYQLLRCTYVSEMVLMEMLDGNETRVTKLSRVQRKRHTNFWGKCATSLRSCFKSEKKSVQFLFDGFKAFEFAVPFK